MRKESNARERLLDIAESSVLAKGFGATSIEEIVAEAGITKNGFFYHFADKNQLARALLQRYIDNEEAILDQLFAATGDESGDPLAALLAALDAMAQMMRDLPTGHPGCLVATYCYSERMFDAGVRELNRAGGAAVARAVFAAAGGNCGTPPAAGHSVPVRARRHDLEYSGGRHYSVEGSGRTARPARADSPAPFLSKPVVRRAPRVKLPKLLKGRIDALLGSFVDRASEACPSSRQYSQNLPLRSVRQFCRSEGATLLPLSGYCDRRLNGRDGAQSRRQHPPTEPTFSASSRHSESCRSGDFINDRRLRFRNH